MPRLRRKHWPLIALPLALLIALGGRLYLDRAAPPEDYNSYTLVEENLYIGGRTHKPPPGTTAVLSLSYNKDIYAAEVHQYSSIHDAAPAPSLEWLAEQVNFVDTQRKAGRTTFVHCDAGCSRSALVTAAYLMQEHRWNRSVAVAFLRAKRPVIRPNPAFTTLLLDWEKHLGLPPAPASKPAGYVNYSTYSRVGDHLYVGGRTDQPPEGTTAVLSMSYNEDTYRVPFHQYSSIFDGGEPPSLDWLEQQVAFIDEHQKANRITYVHCDAGLSRGPMVTAAYLMAKNQWTRDQALAFLKEKRPIISPNTHFMGLLLDWEKELKSQAK